MKVGSLFSGIGGFDLGLERAGHETKWFCEIEPFCQKVLAKHWPNVPIYRDITKLKGSDIEQIDILCGGFPCQDLSVAGKGAGLSGSRSGLWSEYHRLINELRPKYVIVENVPALKTRGLETVLHDLMESGYDAEWDCLPASAFGAPHQRDRIWIVAYPNSSSLRVEQGWRDGKNRLKDAAFAANYGRESALADPEPTGLEGHQREARKPQVTQSRSGSKQMGNSNSEGRNRRAGNPGTRGRPKPANSGSPWTTEPNVGRVAYGVPDRVDRIKALGNALVPQIAQFIGERIRTTSENTLRV